MIRSIPVRPLFLLTTLLFGCGTSASFAQRALTEIPDPDPEYQRSLLQPAEGFEISLFASEPMIAKPTSMAFDSKGRLFVTCTPIYPQVIPGKLPSDQVIRLEDTDGDGRADKSTVFAQGLLIPTAVLPNPDGVYVSNSTELLFFEDRNDDGIADSKKILFSGFGTEDTHHIIHTLRNGPAGRIYWNQSIYIHSHIETPYGYRDLQAGGVWQLRPETLELEVYNRGLMNSWGLQFDQWGQSFQTDGAGSEGIAYSFPGAAFLQSVGYEKFIASLNPGQPKFSGLEIIEGSHFPEDWQGRLITCDFRGNRISSFQLSDSQSGYLSQKRSDLVTSTHGAFRPIDVQNGPDGALYVADWYNPIIQHGEVDFRDERRDHTHGRIWRITARGRPLQESPNFSAASAGELLEFLKSGDTRTRDHARRELKFRGVGTVTPAVHDWVQGLDVRSQDYEKYLLEALWVSQSLDSVNRQSVEILLGSENFKIRAAALRVLEERPERYEDIEAVTEKMIADPSPRVRLETIHVLRKLGSPEAARQLVRVLGFPMDEFLDFALWNALRELKSEWLPAVRQNPKFFGENLGYLLFAIRSVDDAEAIEPLEKLWQEGLIAEDHRAVAMITLAERGSSVSLLSIVEEILKDADKRSDGIAEVLTGLRVSAAHRGVAPSGSSGMDTVNQLLLHEDVSIQRAAAGLLGQWKRESSVTWLKSVAADEFTDADVRSEAVAALVSIDTSVARKALADLARSAVALATRIAVASGYAESAPRQAVLLVSDLLVTLESQQDAITLIAPYLAKPELPSILEAALVGKTLNVDVATALLRRVNIASVDTAGLQTAIQNAAGIEPVNQNLSAEEMISMVEFVEAYGDAQNGEKVYRQPRLLCTTCHAIGGAGGSLGPDLTSIGASAPVDYLIDSLLQPQKQIKEGYHVVAVTKKDGSLVAGRLASENDRTVTLQDAADQLIEVPKSEVLSRKMSPISLMPPGLTQGLRRDEFADLVRFLSQLGKEGDYKVPSNRYIRTYRYLDDKGGDEGLADTLRHKPLEYITTDDPRFLWLPSYASADGFLPLENVPKIHRYGVGSNRYLRFFLNVKKAGDVILKINDPDALVLFVGENKHDVVSAETKVSLRRGTIQFTLAEGFEMRKSKSLRIEVLDAPVNSAQVQLVHGK